MLLTRAQNRPRPMHRTLGALPVALGRVHELTGPSRRQLAVLWAADRTGPVIWITPSWGKDRLHGAGVVRWMNPARLIHVTPRRGDDILWCAEEAVRSGVAAAVVIDVPEPPGLVAVRRLHLAAETGAQDGPRVPLPLLLTPGEGGAPGVETRWHMAPRHGAQGGCISGADRAWHLRCTRARMDPPRSWSVTSPKGAVLEVAPLNAATVMDM